MTKGEAERGKYCPLPSATYDPSVRAVLNQQHRHVRERRESDKGPRANVTMKKDGKED